MAKQANNANTDSKMKKGNFNRNKKGRRDNVNANKCTTGNDRSSSSYGDINDANYYFLDDVVKNQVTDISFNQYLGVPFNLSKTLSGDTITTQAPVVATFRLNPAANTGGTGDGSVTGVNLAALNTYTKLSANNAKTTNYAPQDITMLYLALGQVIATSSHIARLFGATRLYNVRNRAYPKHIIKCMDVNYDDLIDNFSDYRTRYNSLMTVLSSIPIPANVPYFKKCAEVYSHIYLDMEGSSMAQTYVFMPYSTWIIDEQVETGTALNTQLVSGSGSESTMGTLLDILYDQINHLLQSSTLNFIYSDIIRLADKEGLPLMQFAPIPDDYVVLPVYNSEIRKWINNLTITGAPMGADSTGTKFNSVVSNPNTNTITYNPKFVSSITGHIFPVMNFDNGFPSTDDIVDATRLMAYLEFGSDGKSTSAIALPDYYCVSAVLHTSDTKYTLNSSVLSATDTKFADILCTLSAFDWSPFLYVADSNGVISSLYGDLNYFTNVSGDYLKRMFDLGYQALFMMR